MRLNLEDIHEPIFSGPVGPREGFANRETIEAPLISDALYGHDDGTESRAFRESQIARRNDRVIDLTPEWTHMQKVLKEIDDIHAGDGPLEQMGDFAKKFAFPVGAFAAVAIVIGNFVTSLEAIPGMTAADTLVPLGAELLRTLGTLVALDPSWTLGAIIVGGVLSYATLRAIKKNIEKIVNYGF